MGESPTNVFSQVNIKNLNSFTPGKRFLSSYLCYDVSITFSEESFRAIVQASFGGRSSSKKKKPLSERMSSICSFILVPDSGG